MSYHYKATKVSLHVRKSNRGAIRLYEELLGYKVAAVASAYYSDGEDAFVMEAQLPTVDTQASYQSSKGFRCSDSLLFGMIAWCVNFYFAPSERSRVRQQNALSCVESRASFWSSTCPSCLPGFSPSIVLNVFGLLNRRKLGLFPLHAAR